MTAQINYCVPPGLKNTVLEQIVAAKLPEIAAAKTKLPAVSLRMAMDRAPRIRSLKKALAARPGIIAEIKKASPSAGLLRPDLDPAVIADAYLSAGASAISVVTEWNHFHGSLETLAALRWRSNVPLLRKDFLVDPYQVCEARHAGADAVLLIAALLEGSHLQESRTCVEDLGMDALVEVHDETEAERALKAGATLIGVNNRDLRSFEVSIEVSMRLASILSKGVVAVTESGIRTAEDVRRLAAAGYRGFLIGESLIRAQSPGAALRNLLPPLHAEPRP
jgi:indole-3-glycerol phosphate synthase